MLPEAGLPLRGRGAQGAAQGAAGNAPERAKDDVVGETPPAKLIVRENGVPYEVHLRGGINVGLFSDMREHRAGLARFVRERACSTRSRTPGALSLAAARAGAAAVTSVDLAAGPLAWARENFALSGLDPEAAPPLGDVRRVPLPRGRARAPRDLRRHHPRPADGVGRARDARGRRSATTPI